MVKSGLMIQAQEKTPPNSSSTSQQEGRKLVMEMILGPYRYIMADSSKGVDKNETDL